MNSLIDILDFSVEELDELIEVAVDIINNPEKYSEKCKGEYYYAIRCFTGDFKGKIYRNGV